MLVGMASRPAERNSGLTFPCLPVTVHNINKYCGAYVLYCFSQLTFLSGIITMDTINGIKLWNKVEQMEIVFCFSFECKKDWGFF